MTLTGLGVGAIVSVAVDSGGGLCVAVAVGIEAALAEGLGGLVGVGLGEAVGLTVVAASVERATARSPGAVPKLEHAASANARTRPSTL